MPILHMSETGEKRDVQVLRRCGAARHDKQANARLHSGNFDAKTDVAVAEFRPVSLTLKLMTTTRSATQEGIIEHHQGLHFSTERREPFL